MVSEFKNGGLDWEKQDVPITGADWRPVLKARLSRQPYCRVCQVVAKSSVGGTRSGTGWLSDPGVVVTAAHTVQGSNSIGVRFANSATWLAVIGYRCKDGFKAKDGTTLEGSEYDIAYLSIDADADERLAGDTELPNDGDKYRAIGFQDGVLVEHAGSGRMISPFLLHNAHTDVEHSGCPIFLDGEMVAIHVGGINSSRTYLPGAAQKLMGYLNAAVLIG